MRISLTALQLATLALATTTTHALAADCAQPYTSDNLLEDLEMVETAAQGGDVDASVKAASKMEAGLACLDEKLVTMLIGRTYRSIGAGYLVGGQENKGRAWFRTAIEIDPNYSFGTGEYDSGHPVRQAYDALKMQGSGAAAKVEGKELADGKFYLDGRTLREPEAVPGRPHLLQRVTDGTSSWVIDGNAFPADVLTDAATAAAPAEPGKKPKDKPPKAPKAGKPPKAAKAPKAPKPEAASSGFIEVRPPEKTPLMIAGSALIAGAGGMFVGSVLSRQNFDSIEGSEADLQKAQKTTNRLYLGSFAVLAVGAGTLTWGLVLPGGSKGTAAVTARGRF